MEDEWRNTGLKMEIEWSIVRLKGEEGEISPSLPVEQSINPYLCAASGRSGQYFTR
jgi:hypothetical protein